MSSPWEDCKWTRSRYFSFIRSCLRRAWSKYPVKYQALQDARKPYDGEDKRTKWLYQCNICKEHFKGKEVEVDHMIPAGSLKDYSDLAGFVERLFCSKKDLQVLCKPCHKELTKQQREEAKK